MTESWIDKYNPKNIDEICLDEHTRRHINMFINDTLKVHLILSGISGIGKTITAHVIAKQLLGNNYSKGFMYLNSTEDKGKGKGKKHFQTVIESFCKMVVSFDTPKIILLDEADNISFKCQSNICTLIKQYDRCAKFIITCNDTKKIIEDIQSICRIVRFAPIKNELVSEKLINICETEKVKYNKKSITMISNMSNGDMRLAINNLQLVAFTYNNVSTNNVSSICKIPHPKEISSVFVSCNEINLSDAINNLNNIIKKGYNYTDIINSMILCVKYEMYQDDSQQELQLMILKKLYTMQVNISLYGIKTNLQLYAVISKIIKLMC
jgi:replication factor C subunit 2/4